MFDTGNTGFMLVATSLVMLMTPGLAFFYGGLVGRKNVLAIMIQSFVSMGWTTLIWWLVGTMPSCAAFRPPMLYLPITTFPCLSWSPTR